MKKLFLYLVILSMGFASCSSDDSEIVNPSITYQYQLKRKILNKVYAESSSIPAPLGVMERYHYTFDTLEIALNAIAQPSFSLVIKVDAKIDILTPAPDNIEVHVNYINFIDFDPILENNAISKVFLEKEIGYNNLFTYSDSNVELSNYPDLFKVGGGASVSLESIPKTSDILLEYNTTNEYSINEEIQYAGRYWKVVSKTTL